MANVNANINISIETAQAQAQLRKLQNEISAFNRSLGTANTAAASQAGALNRALMDGINSTKMFDARMVPVADSVTRFSTALEKNKLSLGQYTRYAASQLPGMRKVFTNEFQMMEKVATDRVKKMQAQYVALGDAASGTQKALRITPLGLEKGYATDIAVASQKQQIFNKLIDDGSTKLLNWGKNTQWAGRQLMVGFTLPLAALGTVAAQTFMELDKATVAFERVYGDLSTTTEELEKNKAAIMGLGQEYTKFGIKTAEVIDLAARVAATGATNEGLVAATEQTLRLATLGQMDYNTSLEATISLQTAFQVSNEDLAKEVDYLNIVENQTILTMEDMAAAIPRVAPVIKGLGGDVRDLAVMMTALREGGVTAEQGANALKSGLASLINPTDKAIGKLNEVGISLDEIIQTNRGDLMGVVKGFADALKPLDDFSQQQVLEEVFGKFQYARLGALFKNITNDSGQAARAMDAATMSAEELAAVADKELGKISESTTAQFQAAVENLRVAIAPLGEAFMKGVMPIAEFLTKIANAFNDLPDPVKNAIAVITGVIAGLGPVFLMTIGLVGNGLANLVKGIQFLRKTIARVRGDAANFGYLAVAELEAKTATEALDGSVQGLTSNLLIQKGALSGLIKEFQRYASVAGIAGGAAARGRGGKPQIKMASGGVVPGTGSGDKVPALLEPGETVITKKASQRYGPVIAAMNAGTLPGYQFGLDEGITGANYGARTRGSAGVLRMSQSLERYLQGLENGQELQNEINRRLQEISKTQSITTDQIKTVVRQVTQQPEMFSARPEGRRSMGAPAPIRAQTIGIQQSGQFSNEEAYIRSQMGDRATEGMFRLDASHIEKQIDEFGDKIWEASNLFPDFRGVNQTLENRMKSFNVAIEQGTVSISDTARMMQQRAPEFIEGLDANQIEFELERLRRGIHPVTENATKVATSFAKLDAALSREALQLGQERTPLGTVASTGRNAEFLATAGEYRLGPGKEEYFGKGGRSEQRYQEGAMDTQSYTRGSRSVLGPDDDPYVLSTPLRNSPHPRAGVDGRQDAQAYIAAQRSELGRLRQASGMGAKEMYQTSQSETRRMTRDAARMSQIGMSETQITRQQRRLLESKIKQEQAKLVEARRSAALAAQSTKLEQQTNVAKTTQVASQTAGLKASKTGAALGAVRGKAGMIGMGLGMGSMVPFMQGNMGLGMGMMGAGMAFDMLAMTKLAGAGGIIGKVAAGLAAFAGPLAIATAAITAVGVGLYLWRKNVDDAAKKAAELGANLGGTANAVKTMGDLLGKQTPVQRRAQLAVGDFSASEEENAGQYSAILESEAGEKFLSGLKEATSAERFTLLSDYVSNGIASGLMDYDFATGFVKSVAIQLGDGMMGKQVLKEVEKYEDISSKTQAMIDIASKRVEAAQQSDAFKAVEAGEQVSSKDSSSVIGQSLQIVQDFATVAALAEEEFAAGIISYNDYIAALDKATAAQNRYADAILYSITQSSDQGASKQALKDQLSGMGYKPEGVEGLTDFLDGGGDIALAEENVKRSAARQEFYNQLRTDLETANENYRKALEDPETTQEEISEISRQQQLAQNDFNAYFAPGLGGPTPLPEGLEDLTPISPQGQEIYAEAEARAQEVASAMLQAIFNGMDPEEATRIGKLILDPNSEAGKTFKGSVEDLGEYGALQLASMADREAKTPTAGVKKGDYMKAAKQLSSKGGATPADIDSYFQSLPDSEKQDFVKFALDNDKTLKGEVAKKWIQSSKALQSAAGGANVSKITQSSDYLKSVKAGNEGKIADSMTGVSKQLGGNKDAIQAHIDFIMTQDPPDIETRLPKLEETLRLINDSIPPEIQKVLGIDLANPDDVEKYGPMAEALGKLVPAIMALPEDERHIGANLSLTENGEPKDPITFAKDVARYQKTLNGLKSDKVKVRKEAAIDLITQINGPDGKPISLEEAGGVFERAIESTGLTEGEFLQLPPDTISKIFVLQAGIDPKFANMSAKTLQGIIDYKKIFGQDTSTEEAALKALNDIQAAASSGIVSGGNDLPSNTGGGGGGGGKKENPFKDLINSIMEQIKGYADAGAKFKTLFNEKNKFFQILKSQQGIDDKIRRAGLAGTPLGDQIAAMDPKQAQKVLNKITGKGGGLNALGSKVQSAAVLGSVAQRTSEAQTSIEASRAQSTAARELQKRGLGTAENLEVIAGDPDVAKEYIALVNEARKAEKAWKDAGSKKLGKAWQEWKRAQKAVADYVKEVVKAQRLEQATSTAINLEVDTQRNTQAAADLAALEGRSDVSQEVKDWARENPQEYADLVFEAESRVQDALADKKAARTKKEKKEAEKAYQDALKYQDNIGNRIQKNIDAANALKTPGELALEKIDKDREPVLQQFDKDKAQFEIEFINLDQAFKPVIKASEQIIKGLEDQIQGVNDIIKGLQRQVEAQQRIVRGLERQKEMIQRQINVIERQNELDQRRADALSRQNEMVQRQVEKLDRQNELDQRRADALSRQEEMLGRQTEQINRQIEAAERQSELDQRIIEEMGRADEMRQRQAEAINRELELMGRKEEDIRKAYDERIKQLDKVEKAQDRINQKQKDQLDLAKALSTGDIYAAAAAAAQMKENQIAASRQDTRSALEQGMESQIAGLRTSGGLSREQAEDQVEAISDQSYQVQLAIRDIQDQIYERTQALIPLRDQIYNIDLQIRDIADERLVIEDQIYAREQERIPFLDEIYNRELLIRDVNDAIYERNLAILPLKDQQYKIDLQIQGVNDVIYGLEDQIYDIQKNRLEPLQDALEKEQRILKQKQDQLQEAKDNVRVNGLTYEQLNEMIQSEAAIYEYTKAQIIQNNKNAETVKQISDMWKTVTKNIRQANKAASDASVTAGELYNAELESIEAAKIKGLTPPEEAAAAARDAKTKYEKRLADIESTRQKEVAAQRKAAINFQAGAFYAGGKIKKYPTGGKVSHPLGGFVPGDGGRDSVMARLTPGEYVIRKVMVDKYGEELLNSINGGWYDERQRKTDFQTLPMPDFQVGLPGRNPKPKPGIKPRPKLPFPIGRIIDDLIKIPKMPRFDDIIVRPMPIDENLQSPTKPGMDENCGAVYNTYSVNVNVPNANINADEVANKVITKIKSIEAKSIRSYRGF